MLASGSFLARGPALYASGCARSRAALDDRNYANGGRYTPESYGILDDGYESD